MIKKLLLIISILSLATTCYAFDVPTANYTADAYDKLLIHADQADGTAGTDIIDSATSKTITAVADAQVDTAQYKDLTGSTGSILFDGTGDWLTLVDSDDWNFGTGNFTIDLWVRYNTLDGNGSLFFNSSGATADCHYMMRHTVGSIYWVLNIASVEKFSAKRAWTPNLNQWYHLAFVRYGTGADNLYIFIDGVSQELGWDTHLAENQSIPDFTGLWYIGGTSIANMPLDGWIDEFRISKGIARDWAAAGRRRIILITKWWKNLTWNIKEMLCDLSLSFS